MPNEGRWGSRQRMRSPEVEVLLVAPEHDSVAAALHAASTVVTTHVTTLAGARGHVIDAPVDCIVLTTPTDATTLESVSILVFAAPRCPIVVVTDDDDAAVRAIAVGANDVARRDVTSDALLGRIRAAIDDKRADPSGERTAESTAAIIASLDEPAAAIDGHGIVLAVNPAWHARARELGRSSTIAVGSNYFTICEHPIEVSRDDGILMGDGIRSVLRGETGRFALEYQYPGGLGSRWVTMRVTPLGPNGGGAIITHLDITDLKTAEHALQRERPLLAGTVGSQALLFAITDADGVVRHVSERTIAQFELAAEGADGADLLPTIHPRDRATVRATFDEIRLGASGTSVRVMMRVRDRSERWRTIDATLTNRADDPSIAGIVISGSDVTERRLQSVSDHLEREFFDDLPVAIIALDDAGVIMYWNQFAGDLYGYERDAVIGRVADRTRKIDRPTFPSMDELEALGSWSGETDVRRGDGTTTPIHNVLRWKSIPAIGFQGMVSVGFDISDRRRLEQDIAFRALHDELTGLANRRLFLDHLATSLGRSRRWGTRTAVLFIDVDELKQVNDNLGHATGDQLLCRLAKRLETCIEPGDMVARFSGDEFVICHEDASDDESAAEFAERVIEAVSRPMHFGDVSLQPRISVGAALGGPGADASQLIQDADAAMYRAKELGGARCEVFDEALERESRELLLLRSQLRKASAQGEIIVQYEPLVALDSGQVVGLEALARWEHPELGLLPPSRFIGIAERTGMIHELGRTVLQRALVDAQGWPDPATGLLVAVNVSARQLSDPAFPEVVAEVLRDHPSSHTLCLELTESALLDNVDSAVDSLHRLKDLGLKVAIDDFGTGYSSFGYLKQLPIDIIKIDQTFVAGLGTDPGDHEIVSAIIHLAKTLGLEVLAEGVERQEQIDVLRALGCPLAQGHRWGTSVSSSEVPATVAGLLRLAPPTSVLDQPATIAAMPATMTTKPSTR